MSYYDTEEKFAGLDFHFGQEEILRIHWEQPGRYTGTGSGIADEVYTVFGKAAAYSQSGQNIDGLYGYASYPCEKREAAQGEGADRMVFGRQRTGNSAVETYIMPGISNNGR
jgi:hypothetical protein